MLPIWIGLFVIIDGVVVYLVLRKVMAKRQGLGGAGFSNIAQFAGTAAEEAKAYLAANYGGDPEMLPTAMRGLVDRLQQRAQEQGLPIDRESLKQFAASAIVSLRAAKPEDVRAALRSVN